MTLLSVKPGRKENQALTCGVGVFIPYIRFTQSSLNENSCRSLAFRRRVLTLRRQYPPAKSGDRGQRRGGGTVTTPGWRRGRAATSHEAAAGGGKHVRRGSAS
jgi:hypothetical protein